MSTIFRNFLILVLLLGLILFIQESTDEPGRVVLDWYQYRLETSMTVLVFVLNLAMILAFLVGRFVAFVLQFPQRVHGYASKRRQQRALAYYLEGVDAKLAGDAPKAQKLAEQLVKALPDPTLSIPLAAQIAPTPERLHQLLGAPETSFAGHVGLMQQAQARGEWSAVKFHAGAALKLRPNSPTVVAAEFNALLHLQECQAALETLPKLGRTNALGNRLPLITAAVRLQAAREHVAENPAQALKLAQQAQTSCPDFVPAALFRAATLASANKRGPAERVLAEFWHACPRLDVFEKWLELVQQEKLTLDKLQKRVENLLEDKFNHPDDGVVAHVCMGVFALQANLPDLARQHLMQAFQRSANQTVLRKLAQLEDKLGDTAAAQDWLERALDAPPLPQSGDEVLQAYKEFRDVYQIPNAGKPAAPTATAHTLPLLLEA